jgi:GH25 family lysozyme M1 (1,4-beta-N-acetylmuramidase)
MSKNQANAPKLTTRRDGTTAAEGLFGAKHDARFSSAAQAQMGRRWLRVCGLGVLYL